MFGRIEVFLMSDARIRHDWFFPRLLGLVLGLVAWQDPADCDQVWIEPARATSLQSDWYPRAIETVSGQVTQFDAEQLRLSKDSGAQSQVVPATRILWVRPDPRSELEAESMRLFAEGEYSASLLKLPEILATKPPVWRQQWITMTAAVAAWKSNRSDIALELVSQLDRRPLPPMVIAWLPIAWTNRSLPDPAVEAASQRLADPSPLVRLVAASWLLSSPQRRQAITTLKQLEAEPRKEIARFARILSWRTATPPEVIASSDDWQNAIESLPLVWQTGPLTLLVDKLRSANQLETANRIRWSLELTPIQPHFDWMPNASDQDR
jgi:hypothetical protein